MSYLPPTRELRERVGGDRTLPGRATELGLGLEPRDPRDEVAAGEDERLLPVEEP